MSKIKNLISKIREEFTSISSTSLIQFICGLVATELLFDVMSINSILHYGVAIASSVVVIFFGALLKHFNVKDMLRIGFGSIVGLLLICFALI